MRGKKIRKIPWKNVLDVGVLLERPNKNGAISHRRIVGIRSLVRGRIGSVEIDITIDRT